VANELLADGQAYVLASLVSLLDIPLNLLSSSWEPNTLHMFSYMTHINT
jgi:hypothetical protein